MKAVVYRRYGPPEVLGLEEVDKPVPGDDDILVRVRAATVTATDCVFRRGSPYMSRLYTGLLKPKFRTLGDELAGEIEAVGRKVKRFAPGDIVVGTTGGTGANAEYVCLAVERATLSLKPGNLTFEQAAGSCDGFLTALPFLRDTGKLKAGQRVLINGASGSVGSAAVQLARHMGADVTGVCSTVNIELVKSLGAHAVIDYTRDDFTGAGQTYDVIFDTVGKLTFSRCRKSLVPGGVFLEAGIGLSVFPVVLWTSLIGGKRARIAATGLRPAAERTKDLESVVAMLETGELTPVIDRVFPLDQVIAAHRYVDAGHKRGNVVLTVG